MKRHTTAERLKTIMRERNLKQADILRLAEPYIAEYDVPLRKNDLSQYVNGKTEPGQFKLTILAQALDVSETWLMGYDVPIKGNIQSINESLSNDEYQFLSIYRNLNKDGKAKAIEYISDLADMPKYTENQYIVKKAARDGTFEEVTVTDDDVKGYYELEQPSDDI